jgi:hypothetical protein
MAKELEHYLNIAEPALVTDRLRQIHRCSNASLPAIPTLRAAAEYLASPCFLLPVPHSNYSGTRQPLGVRTILAVSWAWSPENFARAGKAARILSELAHPGTSINL